VRELNNAEAGMKLEGPLLASPLSVQNQGSETLYQQLTLSGYPRQAPAAGGNGMQTRTWLKAPPAWTTPAVQ